MNTWHLILLILAVPAQFLVSKWSEKSLNERDRLTKDLVIQVDSGWKHAVKRFNEYTDLQKLLEKYLDFFLSTAPGRARRHSPNQTPARESKSFSSRPESAESAPVEKETEEQTWFAGSTQPRDPRPANVKFKIGQVIRHRRWGYRGVIVGWDETARASESWFNMMHSKDNPHWRTQPNYSIIVDVRDRSDPQSTYVPEENIEIVSTEVAHPNIDHYFRYFNGKEYVPQEWLGERYPHG